MADEHEYTMQVGLDALKHLGMSLYSSIPAVLAEAVANAWDADAEHVEIRTGPGGTITIQDDGSGMTAGDANEKYLRAGYARRERGETRTARHGRPVMGRKGIGKLSLFSIANTVTVHSVKDGESHGFEMRVKDIESALRGGAPAYHPPNVGAAGDLAAGTRITLTDVRPRTLCPKSLRKRLARRFSIIGGAHRFEVSLDGTRITAEDRNYHEKLQYVWLFGEDGRSEFSGSTSRTFRLDPEVKVDGITERVGGWIGTVEKPSQLEDDAGGGSFNRIAVLIRGKMAQEDVPGSFEGGACSKYVVGEIYADFLDRDDMPDIATTGRQLIVEDDPRYVALKEKLRRDVEAVKAKWTESRNEEGAGAALEMPAIREWFDGLPPRHRKPAERIFGRINALALDGDDTRRQLFVSGILAFENLKFRDMLDRLDDIDVSNLGVLAELFSQVDDLEADAYYQITKNRLRVIEKFGDLRDQNAKEKLIQEHLFDHLWLLDPSWERVAATEAMESGMKKALDAVFEGLDDEEKRARLDIQYRTTGNKHVIIELKRPEASASVTESLLPQIHKYRNAATKVLRESGRKESVETVCVLGRHPKSWENSEIREAEEALLGAIGARIVLYDQLIENAQKAYADYVEKHKEITRLATLIGRISSADRGALSPS